MFENILFLYLPHNFRVQRNKGVQKNNMSNVTVIK